MLLSKRTISAKYPWRWRNSTDGWFKFIEPRAQAWQPHRYLQVNRERLSTHLFQAVAAKSPWLYHPCVNRLTMEVPCDASIQGDLLLAVWIAANTEDDLGPVTIPQDCTIWTQNSAQPVSAGQYSLRSLANEATLAPFSIQPELDVWGDSLSQCEPYSWAADFSNEEDATLELSREIRRYYQTLKVFKEALPECYAWVCGVTRVALPLRPQSSQEVFRSGSHPGLPGLVELDLLRDFQICEALVHESAHLYLFLEEFAGTLIDPEHTGLYKSPLRPEPRPLRGILMAFHALAFICAFYRDTLDNPLLSAWGKSELADRQAQAYAAAETIASQAEHLTPAGLEFFELTRGVYDYSTH